METYTIQETAREIERRLDNIHGSSYFTFAINPEDASKDIKIRVSDHSANHNNNSCEERVFSFCTNYIKHSGYRKGNMINEWIVDKEGYCEDIGWDIKDILDFELN